MSAVPHLDISSERHGEWFVVRVSGELDLASAPLLVRACNEASGLPLALFLVDVGFIDSNGLDALMKLSRCSRRLVLVEPSGVVQRLLGLTNTTDAFAVVDSIDSLPRSDLAS